MWSQRMFFFYLRHAGGSLRLPIQLNANKVLTHQKHPNGQKSSLWWGHLSSNSIYMMNVAIATVAISDHFCIVFNLVCTNKHKNQRLMKLGYFWLTWFLMLIGFRRSHCGKGNKVDWINFTWLDSLTPTGRGRSRGRSPHCYFIIL